MQRDQAGTALHVVAGGDVQERQHCEAVGDEAEGPAGCRLLGGDADAGRFCSGGVCHRRAQASRCPPWPNTGRTANVGRVRPPTTPCAGSWQRLASEVMDAAAVVIITGPPGAGKSTTARAVAASFPRSVHLHTDDFWHAIVSGSVPPYRPEADEQNQTVMRVISTAASAYAAGGFVVVVDGIVGPWMLHHFLDPGPIRSRPPLHYVVLRPSRDETLRRAQGRTEPNALIDEAPILAMWQQFSVLRTLEHHVIDTTGHAPSETLTAVRAAVEAGTFLLRRNPVS